MNMMQTKPSAWPLSTGGRSRGGKGSPANIIERSQDDPNSDVRAGYLIAALFFILFIGWAVIARLDAAVIAPGKLVVDGQHQIVQHREGGIVRDILVREGQKVVKGQVLIRLAAADVEAQERALSAHAITLLTQRAGLQAEQIGSKVIAVPPEFAQLTSPADRADVDRAMRIQQAQLRTRLAVVQAERGALSERRAGAGNLGQGYQSQIVAIHQQVRSLDQEMASLREAEAKGFVSQNRIRALERTRAELQGQLGQNSATVAQARDQAGEARLQSLEAQGRYLERTASDLRDVEAALNEALPKLNAARDQFARTQIRSPATGTVVGLQVFTPGGVIGAGQRLMDVVPDRALLSVEGRLSVQDGDDVTSGQKAFVSFDTLHEHSLPPLEGKITRVSADSFTDEKTGETYFTASVDVLPSQLALIKQIRGDNFKLRAGMPVSIQIPVRERTALQYMFEPISTAFRKAGRER